MSNAFTSALAQQRRGELLNELSAKMAEAVLACRDTGKKAKVTVTLTVLPAGEGTVVLDDDVKVSLPKPNKNPSMFFIGSSGELTRNDPNQKELDFKPLPAPSTAAVKELSSAQA